MAAKAQSIKSKGPAPTVDQINADRITQVRKRFSVTIIKKWSCQNKRGNDVSCSVSACKSVLGTLYHRKPSSV
jgi:hypothetical protein